MISCYGGKIIHEMKHMKNTMNKMVWIKVFIALQQKTDPQHKLIKVNHKQSIFIQKQKGQYLHNPSSVKSTLMIKNIKPRAPSFCPPTRVFTQPVTFKGNQHDHMCVFF